jgi:hypothetical protein
MKKIVFLSLLFITLTGFSQVTGKNATKINFKIDNVPASLLKYKEAEWQFSQKGTDGSLTQISGFNVIEANDNSITFEQKEFGMNIQVNFTTKKIIVTENGKLSKQKNEFVNANNDPVELEQPDVIDIDENLKAKEVTSLKWKNELINKVNTLEKEEGSQWSLTSEFIYNKTATSKSTKKFKLVEANDDSVTFEEINEDPSNNMFYAAKLKIDIVTKTIYNAIYEVDVKKWTPFEKDDIGTNVFLIIK